MKLSLALAAVSALASTASAHWCIATEYWYSNWPQSQANQPGNTIGKIYDCPGGCNSNVFNAGGCTKVTSNYGGGSTGYTTGSQWTDGYRLTANGDGRIIWRSDGKYIHCMRWSTELYYMTTGINLIDVTADFLCTDTNFR